MIDGNNRGSIALSQVEDYRRPISALLRDGSIYPSFANPRLEVYSDALDVISTALYVAVTVLLDQLFRQVSKSISLLAVLFGLAGCTVSVLNMYNLAGSINPLLFFGPLTS